MGRHAGPTTRSIAARVVLAAATLAAVGCAVFAAFTLGRGGDDTTPGSAAQPAAGPVSTPLSGAGEQSGQRATVVGVADAVTLDVRLPNGRDVVRVRALGVQGPGECYGAEATTFARRVLGSQAVDLVADGAAPQAGASQAGASQSAQAAASPVVDRFDRRLLRVVLDGGRDYAVLAAEAGIARTYSAGASPQDMPPIREAESRARDAGRGVWGPPCGGDE